MLQHQLLDPAMGSGCLGGMKALALLTSGLSLHSDPT